MALVYSACQVTGGTFGANYNVQGDGTPTTKTTITTKYKILVTGWNDPLDVTEGLVACNSGIPLVGYDSYYDFRNGVYMPYAICRRVNVRRTQSPAVFEADVTFETEDSEGPACFSSPPANITDITPQVKASIGVYDKVLYEDKDGNQCWKLPTGSPYQAPVIEKVPVLNLEITQFESAITFEQLLQRSFKLNSDTYRSQPAGRWMTGAVQAQDHRVSLIDGYIDAVKVTYTITLSLRSFQDLNDNEVIFSHDHIQPLVDTIFVDDNGDLKPFKDPRTEVNKAGYINSADGTEREGAGGAGDPDRPEYVRHKAQGSVTFSAGNGGFLLA